ncbi:MAG TPA: serine--tRNA ligase, partial [Acidimicrobiales bacterium]|nr:serine--tRNA ligase [Acidimicrobiales bacterium]
MLDIRRFRTEPHEVKAALARRGIDTAEVDVVVDLDARQRQLAAERDDLRSRVKALSKEVGRLRKEGLTAEAEANQAQSRELGDREQELADEAADVAQQVHQLLLRIPNTPSPDAPDGAGDADNPVVRIGRFDPDGYGEHQRIPHW